MKWKLMVPSVAVVSLLSLNSNSQMAANSTMSGHAITASAISTASGNSIAGTIRLQGPVPKTSPIAMRSDPTCAQEHPQPVRAEDIVGGAGGTLENVIVFVAQGMAERPYDVPQAAALMQQKGCMYEPHVLAMRAGQTLRVVNADKTTHNIHPMPANNREWNKAQLPGQPIEEKFSREEIAIPVKCNIHPWMHSYIAVFKHPYFTVTGKDGSFALSHLPPGEYTIEAWHEKLGTMTQQVKIAPGENKKIDFTFKSKG
ncbi:MAG: carboxypeptidase regulatory-like domain-containing protein [Acidobacteria bacterium]|nr:carboxypeptidase regulatory-like domain-containing protein [Acidobacteriota bacterium]